MVPGRFDARLSPRILPTTSRATRSPVANGERSPTFTVSFSSKLAFDIDRDLLVKSPFAPLSSPLRMLAPRRRIAGIRFRFG